MDRWKAFFDNLSITLYLAQENSVPVLPIQKTLHLNLQLLELQQSRDPGLLQRIIETLLQQCTLPLSTDPLPCSQQFSLHSLRYQLELLRSSFQAVPISSDHKSLLLLELSRALFNQGFTKSAIATIRFLFILLMTL